MTGRLRAELSAGPVLPAVLPRAAVVALSCTAFLLVPLPAAVIAVGFSVVAAVVPASLGAWAAALAIGLGQLAHPADATDWRSYAALAVVHLLHVMGGMAMVVDPRGWMQVRTLRRPLLRWLWIELPAQAVLAAVLVVPRAPFGTGAGFAIAAAACLCGAAVMIVRLVAVRR